MLVLSRRQHDSVVFPNLNIRVSILRIDGKSVKLGIDAPESVRVLRHEIADEQSVLELPTPRSSERTTIALPAAQSAPSHSAAFHAIRNRMNVMTLGLHLLRRKLELGDLANADDSIHAALQGLEELEQSVAKLRNAPLPRAAASQPRALLIEDNPNESALLAGYLRSCNFDVATASDGVDALEYLNCHAQPDVVLLDMNMPRMDGCTTVQELRSNPDRAGLKIFAVTGRSPDEVGLDRCGSAVNRWFTKPIRPDLLVRELQRELGIVTSA